MSDDQIVITCQGGECLDGGHDVLLLDLGGRDFATLEESVPA
jgi:hypothetical protein